MKNAICSNMNGPGDYHTKRSKSDRERQISYDAIYMWNPCLLNVYNSFCVQLTVFSERLMMTQNAQKRASVKYL